MTRSEQLRLANRNQRERQKAEGVLILEVKLTPVEAALFYAAREKQRGPLADFPARALVKGALFCANSGQPRGKKLSTSCVVHDRRDALHGMPSMESDTFKEAA